MRPLFPWRGQASPRDAMDDRPLPEVERLVKRHTPCCDDDDGMRLSPVIVGGIVRMVEFVLVAAVGYVISLLYVKPEQPTETALYIWAVIVAAFLSVVIFQALQLYTVQVMTTYGHQLSRLWLGWTIMFAAIIAISFFAKLGAEYSRVWLASWYMAGLLVLGGARLGLAKLTRHLAKSGRLDRRAVIVGGGKPAEELIKALSASSDAYVRICGIFDDRSPERVGREVAGYPLLGNVDELVEFSRKHHVDLLIVSLPLTAENRLLQIMKKLWVLPVDVRLSAHTNRLRFRPRTYSYLGNLPFLDLLDKPLTDWDYVVKWLFDKTIALIALILLSPVMLLIALAIKLESEGPVFFRQRRYGFNNELIEVLKFRSMYVDQEDRDASKLVTKDDPRVTQVGRFIRKTSLDELPQLINVLKGDLSLVGPRPHAVKAKAANDLYQDVVDSYFARHRVKPGITGWAQINGWRGETDTAEKIQRRVEHDLYYIENWSVLFDLYILFKTPFALLNTKNAY